VRTHFAAARNRIIVALDIPMAAEALGLARRLAGRAAAFKVGSVLFSAAGPDVVRELVRRRQRVFLDLKFHDIPSVVAQACVHAAEMGASLLTVHASGGPAMLRAARQAVEKLSRRRRPRLLGVTLLTSLGQADVERVGFSGGVEGNVLRLARLALASGCDGVVAAPTEVAALRRSLGKDFLIVTPGIRAGSGRAGGDQSRVATAADAIRAGADYVVVGRVVLDTSSPARALDQIADSIAAALR
jgi:orotidine-5'-phosphate decarboxylase